MRTKIRVDLSAKKLMKLTKKVDHSESPKKKPNSCVATGEQH